MPRQLLKEASKRTQRSVAVSTSTGEKAPCRATASQRRLAPVRVLCGINDLSLYQYVFDRQASQSRSRPTTADKIMLPVLGSRYANADGANVNKESASTLPVVQVRLCVSSSMITAFRIRPKLLPGMLFYNARAG